jgi:hypothetical protein
MIVCDVALSTFTGEIKINGKKITANWRFVVQYMYCGGGMDYYYKLTSLTHIYFFTI